MKCEVHPDQDALGTCVSCGRGVCAICKVNYQGTIHCKQCVEAGRIGGMRQPFGAPMYYPYGYGMPYPYPYPYYQYPPANLKATPNPRGYPDGRLFRIGSVGSMLSGILSIITGVAMLMDGGPFDFSSSTGGTFTIGCSALLALLQLMTAVGFYGFYRNYGPVLPMVSAVALSASGLVYLLMLGIATAEPQSSVIIVYSGVLALGIAQIIMGATILDIRKFLDGRELPMLSALMFVLGGASMCGLVGIFLIGWVLSAIGYIVLAIVLFTAPVPSPRTEGAEPEQPASYPPGAWQR
jgi:hypothetical protein